MVAEELKNAEDNVVDVAETAGFGLLGVVKATGPVDGNVTLVARETGSTLCCRSAVAESKLAVHTHRSACGDGAVLKETVKDRAVITDVVCAQSGLSVTTEHLHLTCSLANWCSLSGLMRYRKSTYSSVWN